MRDAPIELTPNTALLLIDMQEGMAVRTRAGRERANPGAEKSGIALLSGFRDRCLPVYHVFHDDADPSSPFRKDKPEGAPLPGLEPALTEAVFFKSGSSAFVGTGLEAAFRQNGITQVVLSGAVAAFCVTSTCRMAHDLGFRVLLVKDALIGFDLAAHDGGRIDAATMLRTTLSILGADFATLCDSADLCDQLRLAG